MSTQAPKILTPDHLVAIRNSFSWTQADLAERLGLSMETVGSWERGRRPISLAMSKAVLMVEMEEQMARRRLRREQRRHRRRAS